MDLSMVDEVFLPIFQMCDMWNSIIVVAHKSHADPVESHADPAESHADPAESLGNFIVL